MIAKQGWDAIPAIIAPCEPAHAPKPPEQLTFFTVNLTKRHGNALLTQHLDALREAFRLTKQDHPFVIEAMVVLPDHLHCLWRLPPGDNDFPMRWRLIKARFSRMLPHGGTHFRQPDAQG